MKINLKNISIRDRIYSIIFLFLLSALISAFTLNYFYVQSSKYYLQLSASYLLDEQIIQLNESCSDIFNRNIFDLRDKIQNQRDDINNNITSLSKGGKFVGIDETLKPLSGDVVEKLNEVISAWDKCVTDLTPILELPQKMDSTYFEKRTVAINDSISQEIQIERVVLVNNTEMKKANSIASTSFLNFKKSNQKIIKAISNELKDSYSTYLYVFLIIGLINIGIFVFSFIWIRNNIVTPIKSVGKQANIVASGDLTTSVDYIKNDEIGAISSAINSMANYLRNASEFVHQIGEGNLDSRFEGLSSEQIHEGSLAHALISMKQKLQTVASEDDKRNWATVGVAKFADLIRKNNNNLKSLSSAIMSSLVEYTETTQGCIYILDKDKEEKEFLSLSAYYAFDTEKYFKDKIMLGEGIVGQTFLEKKTTYLVEVPENYMKLKSGLGSIDPSAVLIVPLIINDEVFGVIELAAFNEIETHKVEFVEQLGEMIASAISNVRNNEQTKVLLEDSQQLAEQMKSQEEEMRQNMEELSATQEEMARKEIRTQNIIDSIENSFGTAELSIKGVILSANKHFIEFCDSNNLSDIAEKHLLKFISPTDESISKNMWSDLQNGETVSLLAHLPDNFAQFTLAPIKSTSNEYDKILVFAKPIKGELISVDDNYTDALQEELRQNMDALTLTEQTLQQQLNHINSIDNSIGLALLKDNQLVFVNKHFIKTTNLENTKTSINNLLDKKSLLELQNAVNKAERKTINCIINSNEINLEIMPLQNFGESVILLH